MHSGFAIAPAAPSDAAEIAAIYAHHVLHGTASFETEPPETGEIAARMAKVREAGLPWLVARDGEGAVLGYAYAGPFHPRAAYAFTCENSVYIRADLRGQGIGKALLTALIEACEAAGMRQMIALIAGTEPASVALHEKCGFVQSGKLDSVGRKHGKWIDVVHMQRALGAGDGAPPGQEPR